MSEALNKLYNLLDSKEVINYSNDDLFNMGKCLDYIERMKYDYKLSSLIYKFPYKELTDLETYERDFQRNLINHNEFIYILANIEKIIRTPKSLSIELSDYLISKYDEIPFGMRDYIDDLIVGIISNLYPICKKETLEKIKHTIINICNPKYGLLGIETIDNRTASRIFKLGDKVIKSRLRCYCEDIPYSDNLLLPYFRGKIGSEHFEITDYVNVECDKFTRDELYDVYKNLREQGIIWLDPGEDNLGRMNKKTFDNHESKKYLLKQNGFLKNPNYIKNDLNIGDVVIIDLDYLIYEDELEYDKDKIRDITRTMEIYRFATRENLEKRYQEEKKQVKKLVR